MRSSTTSLLCFTLLAMGVSTSQAAPPLPECSRSGLVTQPASQGGPGFTWSIPGNGESPPAAHFSMAVWGDSLTSASHFVDAALQVWGIEKSAVASSFIQAGMKVRGLILPLRAHCASNGWKTGYAYREKPGAEGFSKGLVSMQSNTLGDTVFADLRPPQSAARVRQLTILYEKARPDSSLLLAVSVDGGAEQMVALSRLDAGALRITPDAPLSTVRIRLVSGQVTLHGFAPQYQDAPTAIVDSMSIPGATLRGWSNAGERLVGQQPARGIEYDLVVVQYGTNEGAAPFERDAYRAYLRTNLGRMRKFYPQSRCVLVGPPDRGVPGSSGGAGALKYSAIHGQIASAQRDIGREFNCAFWDWQAAMGGPGAAQRWSRMNPAQMQPDLIHLSAKGYAVSGRLFAEAFPLKP